MKIDKDVFKRLKKLFIWVDKIKIPKPVSSFCSACWTKIRAIKCKEFMASPLYKKTSVIVGIFIVIFVAYVVVTGVMIYGFKSQSKNVKFATSFIPYPIAVVNYQFITYDSYTAESDYIHHFYEATQMETSVDFKEIDQQIVDQLIENKIIQIQAVKYKVKVTKQDEDQVIDGIVQQNGGQDKVEKILNEMYGINLKRFRQLVRIQIMRDKLNEKVIAKVTVDHILIRVAENASADDIAKAKVKADSIKAEISGGLDFAEAAKKYSEDSSSAPNGGKLEPFADGEMVQEFSDVAFGTKVGEVSEPVKTIYGWHIIKVESRGGILQKKFADWISELKDKSFILKMYDIK
ncbi:MAG: peptidylprolyl isomerase [Patescibacteria group bacterium]|jgi:hypothetical protein